MNSQVTRQDKKAKRRSLKARQREARNELILEAAYEVLLEKGYYEASIDEIAERVGISKGTVYLHFESKEQLMVALIEQQIIRFLALIDQVMGEATTVRARLERILLYTYTGLQNDRQLLLMMADITGLARGVIEKQPTLKARDAEAKKHLAGLFEEGKRSGELDSKVPTPIMVATFIALLTSQDNEQLLLSGQYALEDLVTNVSRIFFQGISAPSAKGS